MKDLPGKAIAYILTVVALGVALSGRQLLTFNWPGWELIALTIIASAAQVLKVEGTTRRSTYNLSWLIYGFSIISLDASATIFILIISHLVEWVWHRYPWYIQSFNIANYVIAGTLSNLTYTTLNPGQNSPQFLGTVGILAAMVAFTFSNHLMIGLVLKLARGESFTRSGVFDFLPFMIDFVLLCLGALAGLIYEFSPYTTIFTILPVYLIYSTLKLPSLQRQSEIDPKTKLYNARYFADVLKKEMTRADTFNRPMTLVMADLDLLRNINNTYGHLAGDVVLIGVAQILQKSFPEDCVVARFGGEEFAILMPETTPEEAYPKVESIRMEIERTKFQVESSTTPINATMSFGIAAREDFGQSTSDLIHNADVALYDAKIHGRNRVCLHSEEAAEGIFGLKSFSNSMMNTGELKNRIKIAQTPYQPNPLRETTIVKSVAPETKLAMLERTPAPDWLIRLYVLGVTVAASSLLIVWLSRTSSPDWIGLLTFVLIVIMTETLSIEIYVKNTSVSTSAAPLIAGSLLFGPLGALTLSLVLAIVNSIKKRSPILRMVFNTANHLLSSLLGLTPLYLTGTSLFDHPTLVQISTVLLGSMLVYLTSTMLLAQVICLTSGRSFGEVWNERFRWLAPYYFVLGLMATAIAGSFIYSGPVGVFIVLVPLLMLRLGQVQYVSHTKGMVTKLRNTNTELKKYSQEISILNEELLITLANVIDLRDPYTSGHSKNVGRFASLIAEQMGLPEDQIELIYKAGLLHDIGKLGIPDSILFKPSSLTSREYRVIKGHASLGAEIIETNHPLQALVPIVRHHHERFDGRGYPFGLKGNEIPLEARVVGLADALEAMSSDRPYREALDVSEILNEIRIHAGTQFDPLVVSAFFKVIEKMGLSVFHFEKATATIQKPPLDISPQNMVAGLEMNMLNRYL